MALPIDPVSAVGTGMPAPASHAAGGATLPGAAMPPGEPLLNQSLQALHQAAQAPEAVGHGVRAERTSSTSAPMQLLNHLTNSVIAPARAATEPTAQQLVPGLPDEATLNDASVEGLQRVSTFAIQTSIQLASESTMLSVTSALASAANTTFHQLLSSNE
ncbi:MAG TPA: hypothetical protein VFY73_28310 [Ideonella sp.]|uniref:hypothetical protein n=1 Tax=Ideonella sp. TaxID=1929293 RepID=UPI002E321883|nr:hypothetical protein [Ideonella sp.]HEX5687939.1 hypothetical protein [Ideonella sp.]